MKLELEAYFKQLRGDDPVGAALQETEPGEDHFVETLTEKLRKVQLWANGWQSINNLFYHL